jgi:putative SOS response-associated peptidase YedK
MCNLYSLNKNKNTVATMFRVPHNRTVHIDPLPGIFPNYTAPVVRHAADGEREMVLMSWVSLCSKPLRRRGGLPMCATTRS